LAETSQPPPLIWAHLRRRYWSAKIDDISLQLPDGAPELAKCGILVSSSYKCKITYSAMGSPNTKIIKDGHWIGLIYTVLRSFNMRRLFSLGSPVYTSIHMYTVTIPTYPLRIYNTEVDCMETSTDGLSSICIPGPLRRLQ
jgi:hypothetical protein